MLRSKLSEGVSFGVSVWSPLSSRAYSSTRLKSGALCVFIGKMGRKVIYLFIFIYFREREGQRDRENLEQTTH